MLKYEISNHDQQKTIRSFNDRKQTKMVKISDVAKEYEPQMTKNITELTSVPVASEIFEKEVTKQDGETFTYKFLVINGEEYRVPASVLKQLKAQLEGNPNLKMFKVTKTGTGMNTEYTVIVL